MPISFLARLSKNQEPDPHVELERLASAAEEKGHAWLALRAVGSRWDAPGGRALILARRQQRPEYLALSARISNRLDRPPADDVVAQELYEEHEGFRSFWRLESVEIGFIDAAQIPGHSTEGLSAPEALRGQGSFLYWDFENHPHLAPRASATITTARPRGASPSPSKPRAVVSWEPPKTPLFGVDFSGQAEERGRNRKLWVARWSDGGIELLGGTTKDKLTRRGLREMIAETQGHWVVDFPFGIPANQAAALDLQDWDAYLNWASSDPPTVLRDAARVTFAAVDVPWASRRQVDIEHQTTWFPLFQYLYRQTLLGASEILLPLRSDGASSVRILPWDMPGDGGARAGAHCLIEGFPGHTLHSLGLPAGGYKKREHTAARSCIVDALIEAGLPVEHLREIILADGDGDAVDALLLVYSARLAFGRPEASWEKKKSELELNDYLIEGWFFD